MPQRLTFVICALLAALGVGLMPSPGFAFGDGNTSGGVTNGGTSTGGGSTNTVSGAYAKFYDATVNGGVACTGVAGTAGGVRGTARSTLGPPDSVAIKVRRLSHSTTYNVNFIDATCVVHPLGTLTTDSHGRGSRTFSFTSTPTGNFTLVPAAGDSFQTKNLSF